jgi:hypothetical protein
MMGVVYGAEEAVKGAEEAVRNEYDVETSGADGAEGHSGRG